MDGILAASNDNDVETNLSKILIGMLKICTPHTNIKIMLLLHLGPVYLSV